MTKEQKLEIASAVSGLCESEQLASRYQQRLSDAKAHLINKLNEVLRRGRHHMACIKEKFALPAENGRTMIVTVQYRVSEDGSGRWEWEREYVN